MASNIGTLGFQAPEFFNKVDGRIRYTASVDTFALGLVFKILLDYGINGTNLEPGVGKQKQ